MKSEKIKNFAKENWLIIIALIYLISPVDLLPEFLLPVIGLLDDAGITGVALLKMLSDQRKKK